MVVAKDSAQQNKTDACLLGWEKGILWKPPSHEQAGTRPVKKAQIHLTGPSITVFKDPLAGAAQLGHKQAEGQRGSEALSTA